ncbi:MAG: FecR domain-containing protein, partial [Kofleriaceae bacterium]
MTHDERLGPPAIEPLSDTAWSRIERGVWSELDAEVAVPPARSARRWWLVGGALVAAAAIVAVVLGVRTDSGPLAVVDEPSRVVSGTGPSAVSFGDAHITMDAETALVLGREAGHPVVLIERGAAWFTVAPRDGRPAFIVRAGDASVHVVGTRFRVARSEEQISVAVEHGVVDVRFRGAVTTVGARQHWSSASPAHATEIASATDPARPGATGSASPAPAPTSGSGPDPAVVPDPAVAPDPVVAPDPAPARIAAPDPARS